MVFLWRLETIAFQGDWFEIHQDGYKLESKKPYIDCYERKYEYYLEEKILKEFLSAKITKAEKEALLAKAMSLYHGKFYSIWRRLSLLDFDKLPLIFSFLQRAINKDIYELLDFAFNESVKKLDKNNIETIYAYKNQFHWLAQFLSIDESENWGFRRISEHSNPRFILCYFMYQRHLPSRYTIVGDLQDRYESHSDYFNHVLEILREKLDNKFNLKDPKEKELKFDPNFKSPFPPEILATDELQIVLSKIFSKLFCYNRNK
jgi:hypothetical protein